MTDNFLAIFVSLVTVTIPVLSSSYFEFFFEFDHAELATNHASVQHFQIFDPIGQLYSTISYCNFKSFVLIK